MDHVSRTGIGKRLSHANLRPGNPKREGCLARWEYCNTRLADRTKETQTTQIIRPRNKVCVNYGNKQNIDSRSSVNNHGLDVHFTI